MSIGGLWLNTVLLVPLDTMSSYTSKSSRWWHWGTWKFGNIKCKSYRSMWMLHGRLWNGSSLKESKRSNLSIQILKDEERLLSQSGLLKMGEKLKPQWRNLNHGGVPTSQIVHRSESGVEGESVTFSLLLRYINFLNNSTLRALYKMYRYCLVSDGIAWHLNVYVAYVWTITFQGRLSDVWIHLAWHFW